MYLIINVFTLICRSQIKVENQKLQNENSYLHILERKLLLWMNPSAL